MRFLVLLLSAVCLLSGCLSTAKASETEVPEEEVETTDEVCLEDPTIDHRFLMCREISLHCGCHGYVEFGAMRHNYRCASGYDIAQPCYGPGTACPMGGQAWGARCTC